MWDNNHYDIGLCPADAVLLINHIRICRCPIVGMRHPSQSTPQVHLASFGKFNCEGYENCNVFEHMLLKLVHGFTYISASFCRSIPCKYDNDQVVIEE